MVDLTKKQGSRPVPLSDIAESRLISLSYLEQIFAGLRRNGLVKSHRGPGGGYMLAKPAAEISVASIIKAAEDSPVAQRTNGNIRRQRNGDAAAEILFENVNTHISGLLSHITLDDVIAERIEVYKKVFRTEP